MKCYYVNLNIFKLKRSEHNRDQRESDSLINSSNKYFMISTNR